MKYFDNMMPILEKAMKTQEPVLKQAAEMIADAVAADHLIYSSERIPAWPEPKT